MSSNIESILNGFVGQINSSNDQLFAKLISGKSPFIHISHHFWSDFSELTFSPSFYLVIRTIQDEEDVLSVQLATYNGKLLASFSSEKIHYRTSNLIDFFNQCKLVNLFKNGEIRLCKGLLKSAKKNPNDPEVLRDFLGDRIVTRSRGCHYAVLKNESSCSACKSFLPTSFSRNSPDLEFKSESEDIDDLDDDYNTNEFLDHDDVRVISITSGLPPRLSKLQGITIHKNDEQIPLKKLGSGSVAAETPDNTGSDPEFPEPQVNLTVLVNDGSKEKELPFNDFRKDLNIEQERQRIREPVLAKKRRKSKPEGESSEKRSRNDNQGTKSCPLCNKPFTNISEFMKHLGTCEPEEAIEALPTSNDDVFNNDSDQDEDYKPPSIADKYKREFFPILETKKKPSAAAKKAAAKKKGSGVAVECTICMSTFKHDTNFPQHMKAHQDKIDCNAAMTCPVCNIDLESRKALNPHLKEQHADKGGCCIECLEFMPMNLLRTHLSRKHHHAPEREGQLCPICGKKCYYTADLEIHIAVQHMGLALERPPKDEGEVMCHECGKVFSHRYRLKQHLSTTHNKSRDHPCPFCAKVFCLKHQLTKHLLTHADVKPFKCKYCDYQNVRKYRVTKHCQKQHRVKGTDEDIETMQGADKPSEFVHNVFGL